MKPSKQRIARRELELELAERIMRFEEITGLRLDSVYMARQYRHVMYRQLDDSFGPGDPSKVSIYVMVPMEMLAEEMEDDL